jgi:hypothetical protein
MQQEQRMSDIKEAPRQSEGGKKKEGSGKKERIGGAKAIRHVARVMSGLDKEKWGALDKEAQKEHKKAAKRALIAQNKVATKTAEGKGKKGGKEAAAAAAAMDDDDDDE